MSAGGKGRTRKRSINFPESLMRAIDAYAEQEGVGFSEAVRRLCELALSHRPVALYNGIREIVADEVDRGARHVVGVCGDLADEIIADRRTSFGEEQEPDAEDYDEDDTFEIDDEY